MSGRSGEAHAFAAAFRAGGWSSREPGVGKTALAIPLVEKLLRSRPRGEAPRRHPLRPTLP